jgi:hypothetical protein
MPALVAGIHVSGDSVGKAWMAGTSSAMTPDDWRLRIVVSSFRSEEQ